MILIYIFLSFLASHSVSGTYTYCCFDCYRLYIDEDSSFILIEKSGEWNITTTSSGTYKIKDDTLIFTETRKVIERKNTPQVNDSNLYSYEFVKLKDGRLMTESFNCVQNPRMKDYAYFERE